MFQELQAQSRGFVGWLYRRLLDHKEFLGIRLGRRWVHSGFERWGLELQNWSECVHSLEFKHSIRTLDSFDCVGDTFGLMVWKPWNFLWNYFKIITEQTLLTSTFSPLFTIFQFLISKISFSKLLYFTFSTKTSPLLGYPSF